VSSKLLLYSCLSLTLFRSLLVKIQKQTAGVRPPLPIIQPKHIVSAECNEPVTEVVYGGFNTQPQVQYAYMEPPAKQPFITITREQRLPKSLSAYLSTRIEPAGYRMKRWLTACYPQWSVDLRFGPTVVRSWTRDGRVVYKTLCWKEGLCFNMTVCLHRISPRRITLSVSSVANMSSINMICNLTMHHIFDVQSVAYKACSKGDWMLLRNLIRNKKVAMSDTTAYGSTLLHVSCQRTCSGPYTDFWGRSQRVRIIMIW
jgi:hypothetical protein